MVKKTDTGKTGNRKKGRPSGAATGEKPPVKKKAAGTARKTAGGKTLKPRKPAGAAKPGRPRAAKAQPVLFVYQLISENRMHASWKITPAAWKRIVKNSMTGVENEPFLYIQLYSTDTIPHTLLAEHPVEGQEGSWHLFLDRRFSGRRIYARLCHETKLLGREPIAESGEIDVPVWPAGMQNMTESILAELQQELRSLALPPRSVDGSPAGGSGRISS